MKSASYISKIFALIIAVVISLPPLLACASAAETVEPRDPPWHWSGVRRIVVVPDIHGAYDEFVRLLQATGIVNQDLDWSGGDAHLVSLGDLLDRGSHSRAVMDLFMRLQEQAPQSGGRVHVVLGNHEQMNLVGDLRYVSAGEFAAFANEETTAMLDEARRVFAAANPAMSDEQRVAAFASRYPAGYFAHREAFRPDGRYGRWLLTLPTLIVINDTAFVHGGLPRNTATWTAAQLNSSFSRDLKRYLEVWRELVTLNVLPDDEPVVALQPDTTTEMVETPSTCVEDRAEACEMIEDGEQQALMAEFMLLSDAAVNDYKAPFWYRGSVYCRDILERPVLDEYLRTLGAERVVVGHTPTTDRRVRAIRDGSVIMTDTGMLVSYYRGRPAALVIEEGELLVQYLDPAERVAPLIGFGPVAYGLEQAGLERGLSDGVITGVDKDAAETHWAVTLDYGGHSIAARFFPGGRRGTAKQELAAYALDRLLGTELVAVTVARQVDDTPGALQLAYPNEISEEARLAAGLAFGGWCPMQDQFQLMNLFDVLIANPGRSYANILYTPADWTLRLSGHGLAFGTSGKFPSTLGDDALILAPGAASALARLDRAALASALGDYLGRRQIKALLARRDKILQQFAD